MGFLDARAVVVDALWASAFAANIHFAHEGVEYFSQSTGPSPMQHYWSLAVEEQFYVVWPLLLFGLLALTRLLTGRNPQRLPRRAVLVLLLVVVVASLAWSIHQTVAVPDHRLLLDPDPRLGARRRRPDRAGPGLGGRAARQGHPAADGVRRRRRGRRLVRRDHLGDARSPASPRCCPSLGTALLLLAGHGNGRTLVGRLLSTEPFRVIGDWSYSLYLWHWPILILPVYALDRALTAFESALAVLVTVTLAAYSYQYVEMPFRNGRPAHRLPRRRALALYPASAVLVLGVAAGAWVWTGAQAQPDGDNPPITIAGADDKTGARSTSTPSRWCGPRSTRRATGRPSRARPTRASSSCATASPRSASATTSRTSASCARSARTTATRPWS